MSTSNSERPTALSPPALGKLYGIAPEKIIAWIRRGELLAIDVSDSPGRTRPRFRVRIEDWEAFLRRREVKPRTQPSPKQRSSGSRRKRGGVVEYF